MDVHAVNEVQETALHIAARSGCVDAVRTLIERGAKADRQSDNGRTPFLIAARRGREAVCEFMLAHGLADLCVTDHIGNTALLLACRSGSLRCVQLMIEHGAELDVVNEGDQTPLMMAARAGSLPLLKALLSIYGSSASIHINTSDSEHTTAVLHACRKGTAECIEYLISCGASLQDTDAEGGTALMHAAMGGNHELAEWLIDVQAVDIDCRRHYDGLAAINLAIRGGHLRTVKALLARGARLVDPHVKSQHTLPLAQACASESTEMVDLLLARGFSFDFGTRHHCLQAIFTLSNSVAMYSHVFQHLDELDLSAFGGIELPVHSAREPLCEALADNCTIERLSLRGQPLTDVVLPPLARMLAKNRHLSSLDLRDVSFSLDATEQFVADVAARNRSLLTLELDAQELLVDHHRGQRGRASARRHRLVQAIDDMAARALGHRRKVAETAVRMLVAARLLLQPMLHRETSDLSGEEADQPVIRQLPVELMEAIVSRMDAEGVLTDEERRRVLTFARRDMAETRDKTRSEFLRECMTSLTWWPDSGRAWRDKAVELRRKRKRRSADSHGFCSMV